MKRTWIMVAATVFSSPLFSQQATDSTTLDEVIVTANKISQKQSSTGKVVQVINRETLEQNAGRTLAQVLNEQAGLYLTGAQNNLGTVPGVYMRGASSANTLVLVDGMPVTDASGVSIDFDINHFAIDQIERVEILKGAQSVLYGSDAVAGVINIITKKSTSKKKLGLNGQLSAGSYHTFKGNLGLSGETGKFNYSAQYNRLQAKGFSAATDTTKAAGFDKDGFDQNLMNLSLGMQASEKWKLHGYFQYSDYHSDIDDGAYSDDKNNRIYNRQQVVELKSTYQLPKGQFVVHANYNHVIRDYRDDLNNPVGQNDWDPSYGIYKGTSFYTEAYITSNITDYFSLLGGIDYRRNLADITTSFSTLSKDSLEAGMMSAYLSGHLHKNNRLGVELGGRFTQHQEFGEALNYSINPYYAPIPQLKVFAAAGSAFRAPSVYNLASEYGNTALDPERSHQQEAGVQYTSTNSKIFARAVYFRRTIKDIIYFASTSTPPYGQYRNADEQKDKGFELEAKWKPIAAFTLSANYSHVDGKFHTTSSAGKDSSYFNLYRRPKNNVNIHAGYQIMPALFVSLNYRWVDKRLDTYYNESTYAVESANLKSFYNLDLYAKYQLTRQVSVFVELRNLTDQEYYDQAGFNSRRFNMMGGLRWQY
ncbi:MAG TPA: TonB-dependent receptor [Flavihumibacter sp.]